MELGETFELEEDMQRVHIPAFLQLEVPISWNESKVLKAIDEMRLRRTPDMKIRIKPISTDDLNKISEIEKTLLSNMEEVGDEIRKMMSWIQSEAGINTAHLAEVGVNLKLPDIKESLPYANAQVRVVSSLQLRINLHRTFSIDHNSSTNVGKCVIINGLFVFVAKYSDELRVYNEMGFYLRHINLSSRPLFISVMNEDHAAVVFEQNYIEVVNIKTGQVKNHIVTRSCASGISYQNQLLYVFDQRKVNVMNLKGKVIRSFACPSFPVSYLATDVDRLFYTETIGDSLYCCDLKGTVIWKFTNDKIRGSIGMTIDGFHNIYVSCNKFNTVLLISMDGYHYKELLTEKDGLRSPGGIYYDKSKNNLLVCNTQNNDALLFDVEH